MPKLLPPALATDHSPEHRSVRHCRRSSTSPPGATAGPHSCRDRGSSRATCRASDCSSAYSVPAARCRNRMQSTRCRRDPGCSLRPVSVCRLSFASRASADPWRNNQTRQDTPGLPVWPAPRIKPPPVCPRHPGRVSTARCRCGRHDGLCPVSQIENDSAPRRAIGETRAAQSDCDESGIRRKTGWPS